MILKLSLAGFHVAGVDMASTYRAVSSTSGLQQCPEGCNWAKKSVDALRAAECVKNQHEEVEKKQKENCGRNSKRHQHSARKT